MYVEDMTIEEAREELHAQQSYADDFYQAHGYVPEQTVWDIEDLEGHILDLTI